MTNYFLPNNLYVLVELYLGCLENIQKDKDILSSIYNIREINQEHYLGPHGIILKYHLTFPVPTTKDFHPRKLNDKHQSKLFAIYFLAIGDCYHAFDSMGWYLPREIPKSIKVNSFQNFYEHISDMIYIWSFLKQFEQHVPHNDQGGERIMPYHFCSEKIKDEIKPFRNHKIENPNDRKSY